MSLPYQFLNLKDTVIKSEKLFSYPADKKLTAFNIRNSQPIDEKTLNSMFDKNTDTKWSSWETDGDQPRGIKFHLEQHSIFKRLTVTFKSGSKATDHGKICLLLDDTPPSGDSTGCNPTFDSKSGEMSWEDFHMNIVTGSQNLKSLYDAISWRS